MNTKIIGAALALLLFLPSCASKPNPRDKIAFAAYQEANDPIEPLNRYFFELTRFADFFLLENMSKIYTTVVPKVPRQMLQNFYSNLREPLHAANNGLQGSFTRAGISLGRFTINTTLGLAGFFDVADYWFDLGEVPEDFGQTLAVYGMPEGPFLWLPFLGPSSFRDAMGAGLEQVANPFNYFSRIPAVRNFNDHVTIVIQIRGPISVLEFRGSSGQLLAQAERESIDFYATVREFYRQNRRNAILNGELDFEALPEIPDDNFFDNP